MKTIMKSLCLAALLVLSAEAFSQPKATRISGHLEGLGDSVMIDMVDMNLEGARFHKVFPVTDGNFEFTVEPEHVCTLMMRGVPKPGQAFSMMGVQVTLMPGEDVVVSGTMDDYTFGGSTFYDECLQAQAKLKSITSQFTQENYEAKMKEAKAAALDYIRAHPSQEAAMTLIGSFQTVAEMKEALQLFNPSVREGRMQWFYKPLLKILETQELRAENAKRIVEGATAPAFTLPDLDGKPVSLADFRGKYVVLDFWGSWCHWCIKGFPDMRKTYNKYKGQLEILGIDCNDTEDKWRAAVKANKAKWKHVRQSNNTANVSDMYGVRGFPTKIIIDPDGKIINIVVGESPEFYDFLDQTFKRK